MRRGLAIEDIEALRQYEGIDDVQLERAIKGLQVGDHVKLTLLALTPPAAKETVLVCITRVRGHDFCGKLASSPTCAGLSSLHLGSPVTFTATHIHSIARKESHEGE